MDFARTPRRVRAIQLTSLIDVTFLLLKFFILTSTFSVVDALDVSLPAAVAEAPKESKFPTATVDLMSNGSILINGRSVTMRDLDEEVKGLLSEAPDRKVLIRCDKAVVIQRLVDMMDSIYINGGHNISVFKLDKSAMPSGAAG